MPSNTKQCNFKALFVHAFGIDLSNGNFAPFYGRKPENFLLQMNSATESRSNHRCLPCSYLPVLLWVEKQQLRKATIHFQNTRTQTWPDIPNRWCEQNGLWRTTGSDPRGYSFRHASSTAWSPILTHSEIRKRSIFVRIQYRKAKSTVCTIKGCQKQCIHVELDILKICATHVASCILFWSEIF